MYINQNTTPFTRPLVIPISGKAENGKDTVAAMMKDSFEKSGRRVQIVHYADMLKFVCRQYYGWNGEKDASGRALLQYVGTEVYRSRNMHFWVEHLISIFDCLRPDDSIDQSNGNMWRTPDVIIVPDARFPNEILGWVACGYPVLPVAVSRVVAIDINTSDGILTDPLPDDLSKVVELVKTKKIVIRPFVNSLSDAAKAHNSETALDPYVFNVDGKGVNPNIRLASDMRGAFVCDLSEFENSTIVRCAAEYMKMHTKKELDKATSYTSELDMIQFSTHLSNVFKKFLERTMVLVTNLTGCNKFAQYDVAQIVSSVNSRYFS